MRPGTYGAQPDDVMSRLWFLRASTTIVLVLGSTSPSLARADEPAKVTAPTAPPPPLAPRSRGLAVTFEVVSPVGGAGCFYRRSYLPGALVMVGSAISGGSLAYALATSNRDGAIINAVAYGVARLIGIVAAARPEPAPVPAAPPPDPGPLPSTPARSVGLTHAFTF
jgi:hypothetical protein